MDNKIIGDYEYNGVPVFEVNFNDFNVFIESRNTGRKIYTENIMRGDLKDYYRKQRGNNFIIKYNGVMVNLGKT